MWVAAQYADRVILLKDGRLLADGTSREIFSQEHLLNQTHLKAPDILQLSNLFGCPCLTIEEAIACLEKKQ